MTFFSFLKRPFSKSLRENHPSYESDKSAGNQRIFHYGSQLSLNQLKDENFIEITRQEASIIVAENAFKMTAIQPQEGSFSFKDSDEFLKFAQSLGISLRGHTLNWYRGLPSYYLNKSAPEIDILITNHITTILEYYKASPLNISHRKTPVIVCWDVVNEGFDTKGGEYRKTFWYNNLGKSYIEKEIFLFYSFFKKYYLTVFFVVGIVTYGVFLGPFSCSFFVLLLVGFVYMSDLRYERIFRISISEE